MGTAVASPLSCKQIQNLIPKSNKNHQTFSNQKIKIMAWPIFFFSHHKLAHILPQNKSISSKTRSTVLLHLHIHSISTKTCSTVQLHVHLSFTSLHPFHKFQNMFQSSFTSSQFFASYTYSHPFYKFPDMLHSSFTSPHPFHKFQNMFHNITSVNEHDLQLTNHGKQVSLSQIANMSASRTRTSAWNCASLHIGVAIKCCQSFSSKASKLATW